MKREIRITSEQMVEWYDGFVSGLITADGEAYLVALLAFDATAHKRRYVLLPDSGVTSAPPTLATMSGRFQDALARVAQGSAQAWLSSERPEAGVTMSIDLVPSHLLEKLGRVDFPCIDMAVEPESLRDWLRS
jgi:hypothetical protein